MMMTRSARVESPLGEGALLFLSMSAREALGRPFSFTVDVLAEDDTLDFSQLLGQIMTVEFELDLLATRQFSGYVTEIGLVGGSVATCVIARSSGRGSHCSEIRATAAFSKVKPCRT